jgi:phosphoglycolate phosphatase-like HAD superfamily hydrolase
MAHRRLILWDIDGTLTRGGRHAVEVFHQTLRTSFGLTADPVRFNTSGMTDSQIALQLLASAEVAEADALAKLDAFRDLYAGELEKTKDRLVGDLVMLPGVPETLAALADGGHLQSLLTGNYEPTARIKLACVGVDHFLDFTIGAFGSDHRDRNCLVPVALEKLRRLRGETLQPEQVVVVGDTPRDVACARAGGARAIAVATGSYGLDDLRKHEPDGLLESLSDVEAAVEAILSA